MLALVLEELFNTSVFATLASHSTRSRLARLGQPAWGEWRGGVGFLRARSIALVTIDDVEHRFAR